MSYELANPRPGALIESLRSVGYSLPAALADIVDNSIAAQADNVWIDFHWAGQNSSISILDDGVGMTEPNLVEAMRPGTMNPLDSRDPDDLGRFGLGLKTASFSQGRELHVWTRAEGQQESGRCWDLDYVAQHNEWRLRKDLPPPDVALLGKFRQLESGTLVIWKALDRVLEEDTPTTDDQSHRSFLGRIREVEQHLAMVFHRFLSGSVGSRKKALSIRVNGMGATALLKPWDPFEGGSLASTDSTPTDRMRFRGNDVVVRGFVLPHKDRLPENEYSRLGGPKGWIAQQGFYVYRNDRILVAGDWLRLGRGRPWGKEEHYKLARLSIDIPNSMDMEWALDVKKSRARPPAVLHSRLTDLAEKVRNDARRVFSHRGQYGPRAAAAAPIIDRPWDAVHRNDRIAYRINRSHPLIAGCLQKLGPLSRDLEPVFRVIEEGVPVERIWLDKADAEKDHTIPYEGLDANVVREDIEATFRYLRKRGESIEASRMYLLATSPFDRYPSIVHEIVQGSTS